MLEWLYGLSLWNSFTNLCADLGTFSLVSTMLLFMEQRTVSTRCAAVREMRSTPEELTIFVHTGIQLY